MKPPSRTRQLAVQLNRRRFAFSLLPAAALLAVPPTAQAAAISSFTPYWVENFRETHLWSGPSDKAVDYGAIAQWSYLQVVQVQSSLRLYVLVPWSKNYAYVNAADVGPAGPPPPGWTPPPLPTPAPARAEVTLATRNPSVWNGQVTGGFLLVRSAPLVSAPIVQTLPHGAIVQVSAWVYGDQVTPGDWTWAQLTDGHYAYTEALTIIPPTTPPPMPANPPSGKWIDVNLLHQTVVAYQDNLPVHMAIAATGSPGWETPVGVHQIWRRVADETMKSSTLSSLGLDAQQLAQAHYDLKHVLNTQYFDDFGDALHDNYWLPAHQFGVPHSHGCVGLPLAESQWFWDWADIGVPVVVH